MKQEKLYRYTSNGEGIYSIGKRLLPENLANEAWEARKWLPKPVLQPGEYLFFLTEKGRRKYEETLLRIHEKYLDNIELHQLYQDELTEEVIYQDEWQIVFKKN